MKKNYLKLICRNIILLRMAQNSYINIIESIKKENSDLNKLDKEINDSFKNELEKVKFIHRIQSKIDKLSNFRIYLQFKYGEVKFAYDLFSIFLIIISALLTIIEAVKNEIDYEDSRDDIKYFFKLSPIFISSLITLLGTFIKFKKYQEDSENMSSVLEKSVLTIYRMKKLQEKLYYADNSKLNSLKDMYLDEIFILYNQTQVEIRNCISYTDLQKYEIKRLQYDKLNLKKYKKKMGLKEEKKEKSNTKYRKNSDIDSQDEYNFRENINNSPGPGAENFNYNTFNDNKPIKILKNDVENNTQTPINNTPTIVYTSKSTDNNIQTQLNTTETPVNNSNQEEVNTNLTLVEQVIEKENTLEEKRKSDVKLGIKEKNILDYINEGNDEKVKEHLRNIPFFNNPDEMTGIRDFSDTWSSENNETDDEGDNLINNNPDKMTSRQNNIVSSNDY